MFINISKKAYQRWSQKELEAANSISNHIVNVYPPNFVHSMSNDDIECCVRNIVDDIHKRFLSNPTEPVDCILVDINDKRMTYQLVSYLRNVFGNVPVICPVFKCKRIFRTVGGTVHRGSEYEFVGFKEY